MPISSGALNEAHRRAVSAGCWIFADEEENGV
jgi:hypothetical protein